MDLFSKEIKKIYQILEQEKNPKQKISKLKKDLIKTHKKINLPNTIQILFLNKFCTELDYTNRGTIEYFSNITSKYAINILKFPNNQDFVYYQIDQITKRSTVTEEMFNIELGNLYFMNSTLLHNYHSKKHKPIGPSYYEFNAKKTYEKVVDQAQIHEVETLFSDILIDFKTLKTGISEIAQENIFN